MPTLREVKDPATIEGLERPPKLEPVPESRVPELLPAETPPGIEAGPPPQTYQEPSIAGAIQEGRRVADEIEPPGFREKFTRTQIDAGMGLIAAQANMASGLGGALRHFGAESMGESLTRHADKFARQWTPPDPNLAFTIGQAYGSTIPFWIAGLGVSGGVMKLATVAPRLANLFGISTMSAMESMIESGSGYNEVVSRGGSEEEASTAANKIFATNLPVLMITNRYGLFGSRGGAVRKMFTSALNEGSQEAWQELMTNLALKDRWSDNVAMAGMLGALVGGTLRGGGIAYKRLRGMTGADPVPEAETAVPPPPAAPSEPLPSEQGPALELTPVEGEPEIAKPAPSEEEIKGMVEKEGLQYSQILSDEEDPGSVPLVYFNDVATGSTLVLPTSEISPESLKEHVKESREKFYEGAKKAVEESGADFIGVQEFPGQISRVMFNPKGSKATLSVSMAELDPEIIKAKLAEAGYPTAPETPGIPAVPEVPAAPEGVTLTPVEGKPELVEGEIVKPTPEEEQRVSVENIIKALKESKPLRAEQERIYKKERGKRLARFLSVVKRRKGEAGFYAGLGQLKGEIPKVVYESIRGKLSQKDVENAFELVKHSPMIEGYEIATAGTALAKLFGE
jgi:hypothetical protein